MRSGKPLGLSLVRHACSISLESGQNPADGNPALECIIWLNYVLGLGITAQEILGLDFGKNPWFSINSGSLW